MMIEESGDNWYYTAPTEIPTVQVVATVTSVERTETTERVGKKRKKARKPPPFGFARALASKQGKHGRR